MLAEKLFDQFELLYGIQKMRTAWGSEDPSQREKLWNAQLARFGADEIGKALQSLVDDSNGWPPTLPEFVKICRSFLTQAHMPALPYEPKGSDVVAKKMMARAKAMMRKGKDELLDEPVVDGVIGRIQKVYKTNNKNGPNKQWACRHLLNYAGGASMKDRQLEYSMNALRLTADDLDELSAIRKSSTTEYSAA